MRARLPLLLLPLLLVACGGGSDDAAPVDGVVHLDPRLADGASSAAVLSARGEVVRGWVGADALGELRTVAAETTPTPDGAALEVGGARSANRAGLAIEGPFDAATIDVVELAGVMTMSGRVWVRWRKAGQPEGRIPSDQSLRVSVSESAEFQVVRFPMRSSAAWEGTIAELVVEPVPRGGGRPTRLEAVRLLRLGFLPNADPVVAGEEHRGDGGLVTLEGVSVRAWPTDFAVTLSAPLTVPAGGRLELATAVAPGATDARYVCTVVSARAADGGFDQFAGGHAVPRGEASTWVPLAVDLAPWVGQEVELTFTSWPSDTGALEDEPPPGELEAARVYYGAPMVLRARPEERLPNVVLVTLDTLRADALGASGGRVATPTLDGLAAEGVRFTNAWSVSNATQPAHASILAGTFVKDHGVANNYAYLATPSRTLAEELREAGYVTAAAVSQQHLGTQAGFGQGFDLFLEASDQGHLDGSFALERLTAWLDGWSAGADRPVFLWVHLFDPHTPYTPPRDWLDDYAIRNPPPSRTLAEPTLPEIVGSLPEDMKFLAGVENLDWALWAYDSGVVYTDDLMAALLDDLRARGLLDHAAVAVTADHGESLGEHDLWFHHRGVFDETVRVPLLLSGPGLPAGAVVDAPVATIDLAPTLLAMCGRTPAPEVRGVDLAEAVRGDGDPRRTVWFEHSDHHQIGLRDERYHAVLTLSSKVPGGRSVTGPDGRVRLVKVDQVFEPLYLFDHVADPGLTRNLAKDQPDLAQAYAERLRAWLADHHDLGGGGRVQTGAELDHLANIGYAEED